MHPTIQKLNNIICEDYTVSIVCDRSTILDSYEAGELEEVYHASSFYERSFDTNPDFLSSGLKTAVANILIHYTQYTSFKEFVDKNFDYSDDEFIVYRHVNRDRNEPTIGDVEMWKIGKEELYAQYTHIKVRVNNRLIGFELIKDLIEMEVN